jgi:hypothetical protein
VEKHLSEPIAEIIICQGPPFCPRPYSDAVRAMETGSCSMCKRRVVYNDGSDSDSIGRS